MRIKVSKRDILWAFFAQIFGIGSGFFILPLILYKLSAEEVGLNYLMLTIGSIANLFDLGFVVQFGRNITYILSGANSLQEKGVCTITVTKINYKLLNDIINTAKYVYKRLSWCIFLGLLLLGTSYIYNATDGFITIKNSFIIWIIFCISIFFNIYFKYLESLLNGASMIEESQKAMIYSKSAYMIISIILLLLDYGLFSVVIANLVSPFISRYYCYHKFYTQEIKDKLSNYQSTKEDIKNIFSTIWVTTKLLALNMIGSFASNQAGLFIAGLYLNLIDLGSYGLMLQLFNILSGLALCINQSYQVLFCKNNILKKYNQIIKDLSFSTTICFLIKLVGCLCIIVLAPKCLIIIKSQSTLPSLSILAIYTVYSILHDNMVCFCTYITTGNMVPFVKPSIITAFFVILLSFILLHIGIGLYAPIIAVLISELAYNIWKWPIFVVKNLNINLFCFYKQGFIEIRNKFFKIINKL